MGFMLTIIGRENKKKIERWGQKKVEGGENKERERDTGIEEERGKLQ